MPQHTNPTEQLAFLRTVASSSPRLVWYGTDGRVELSGRVFDNWVAKTANLLVDELDAVRGTRVAVHLSNHWKAVVWAYAVWQAGGVVLLPRAPDDGDGDIVVTSSARSPLEAPRILVPVALGALALRWPGELPRGAVDYAAEVRSHGDVFPEEAPPEPGTVLVEAGPAGDRGAAEDRGTAGEAGSRRLSFADLSGGPEEAVPPATVALLEPGCTVLRALEAAASVWGAGGTLILMDRDVPVTDRILAGERVTVRLAAR
ncbi:TIGR03089 family protein [Arthrobacter sp. H41]|uniref:TIGR03089 family protein n=1 Tax=Arthrobacter sp. H41 TaxID=1312978 RepID=UPI0004B13AE6|nr:TIGR03089 family protein [Arthrobacter sp. H41]